MILVIFWLEFIEYILLFLAFITLVISFFNNEQLPLFFSLLIITLILNNINRFRSENRTKARIAGALSVQLKHFSEEVNQIQEKIDRFIESQKKVMKPPKLCNSIKSDDKIIADLQEDILSINQSIITIIDYFKENNLDTRLKTLEQLYQSDPSSRKLSVSGNYINLPPINLTPQPLDYDITPPPRIAWRCIHILKAHEQSVTDLQFTADEEYLLTTSWDQNLKLWRLKTGDELDSIQGSDQGILTVSVSKTDYNNHGIVTGGLDQFVKIWSLKSDKGKSPYFHLEDTLTNHTGSVHGVAIASEKKMILSGSYDQTLKQWDLETGELIVSNYDERGGINAIAVNELGEFVAVGGGDGVITLWQLGGKKKLALLVGNLIPLDAIAISDDGNWIAGGCEDGSIKIWRLPVNTLTVFLEIKPSLELKGHHGQVMDLCFTPDGQLLYSGGVDGFIKIWHPATVKELGHLKITEDNRVISISLSEDGTILAAGGVDGTVKIWQQT